MIALDTNAAIAILNGRPESVRRRLAAAISRGESVTISSVVLFELLFGAAKSRRRAENEERIRVFLSGPVDVLPFDDEDAAIAGVTRATLEAAGQPIEPFDLLIAAQALRRDGVLVTANAREFSRIEGLRIEDWTR